MPSTAWQPSMLKPPPVMGTRGHTFPPSEDAAKATWGIWFKCRGPGQGLGICISNKPGRTRAAVANGRLSRWSRHPGAELPAGLAVPAQMEDHHPGLHPVAARRQHAEEEPGGVQHAGGRGRVRAAAAHPCQQLPAPAADGCQLQEASHHARRCQQHLPEQVSTLKLSPPSRSPWPRREEGAWPALNLDTSP